jgi:hypothetical protein
VASLFAMVTLFGEARTFREIVTRGAISSMREGGMLLLQNGTLPLHWLH